VTPFQQQLRPTNLQTSKPILLKRDGTEKGVSAISIGNIVTADGTTTLKITGGNVTSTVSTKLPNIIRSQSGHQQQGIINNKYYCSKAIIKSKIVTNLLHALE
jgi:hypothetical protein